MRVSLWASTETLLLEMFNLKFPKKKKENENYEI